MVILRLFTVLPACDPKSDDIWVNRSHCDSLALAKAAMMQPWTEDVRRALKELTAMDFDTVSHCAVTKDGARHALCSLPDDVCAALGILVLAETADREKVFPMFKELESARTLRVLQSLPQTFRFAVTREAYDRIIRDVESAIQAQAKADKKKNRQSSWFFAAKQYDFAVESPAPPAVLCPAEQTLQDIDEDWGRNPALLRRMLLAQRDKLPALLHTVPETKLGTVDGVPVTGQLIFTPDALLPICVFPRRPVRFGLYMITRRGGAATTVSLGDTTRGGLLAVCSYARLFAKPENGSVSVCLVTDDHGSLEGARFCITITADAIRVTDYRAALETFAEATKYLLPPENSGKPVDFDKNDGI